MNSRLILANGPTLRTINLAALRNSNISVIGINRSYMLYPDSDYLYLQDPVVVLEMFDLGYTDGRIKALNIITSKYFLGRLNIELHRNKVTRAEIDRIRDLIKNGVIEVDSNKAFGLSSPYTLPMAINNNLSRTRDAGCESEIKFYLAGCDLVNNPTNNHFWQHTHHAQTRQKPSGGSNKRQLFVQFIVMRRLRHYRSKCGFKVISCSETSKLNVMYPYEPLSQVLGRHGAQGNNTNNYKL